MNLRECLKKFGDWPTPEVSGKMDVPGNVPRQASGTPNPAGGVRFAPPEPEQREGKMTCKLVRDLRAEVARMKRADDEATKFAIEASDLRAKVERLKALLREALCRATLPDGMADRIDAALGDKHD